VGEVEGKYIDLHFSSSHTPDILTSKFPPRRLILKFEFYLVFSNCDFFVEWFIDTDPIPFFYSACSGRKDKQESLQCEKFSKTFLCFEELVYSSSVFGASEIQICVLIILVIFGL
jgi:hypothetical protein